MVSVPARRRQVEYGRERGLSARRACTLFSVARSALDYHSRQAAKDAAVMARMKELSAQYPRYGYRRMRIFLSRDGHAMSPGRAHRLWRTARLQVPRKRPRKRIAAAARPRPQAPTGPNQVWSYDFVFDHAPTVSSSSAQAPRVGRTRALSVAAACRQSENIHWDRDDADSVSAKAEESASGGEAASWGTRAR
jgi:HTH-like domain